MHRAIVAVKVFVVKLVEIVSRPWPLKPVVAEPRPNGAVDNATNGDARVLPERDWDQSGAVVQRRFNNMLWYSSRLRVCVCVLGEGEV